MIGKFPILVFVLEGEYPVAENLFEQEIRHRVQVLALPSFIALKELSFDPQISYL